MKKFTSNHHSIFDKLVILWKQHAFPFSMTYNLINLCSCLKEATTNSHTTYITSRWSLRKYKSTNFRKYAHYHITIRSLVIYSKYLFPTLFVSLNCSFILYSYCTMIITWSKLPSHTAITQIITFHYFISYFFWWPLFASKSLNC